MKKETLSVQAPPAPMVVGEPGSPEWWRSPGFVLQGPADTILRLLEQEEISRRKALELLAYLWVGAPQDAQHALPPAPWDKLNWCDDRPDITVREACRQRMKLDGADAQALEHALTITERERDVVQATVDDAYEVIEDRAGGVVPNRTLAQQVEAMADRWGEAMDGRDHVQRLLRECADLISSACPDASVWTDGLGTRVDEALTPSAEETCEWCDKPVNNGETHGEGRCFDVE